MELYNTLNEEFKFNGIANLENEWESCTFCDPTDNIELWIKKAHLEASKGKTVVLLTTMTDAGKYHKYIYGKNEIRFAKESKSMVIIWK